MTAIDRALDLIHRNDDLLERTHASNKAKWFTLCTMELIGVAALLLLTMGGVVLGIHALVWVTIDLLPPWLGFTVLVGSVTTAATLLWKWATTPEEGQ